MADITPEAAIIVLNRLNTENRIDVDRAELRAAVRLAIKAVNRVFAKRKPIDDGKPLLKCPSCGMSIDEFDSENYCFNCGQALDWDGGESE